MTGGIQSFETQKPSLWAFDKRFDVRNFQSETWIIFLASQNVNTNTKQFLYHTKKLVTSMEYLMGLGPNPILNKIQQSVVDYLIQPCGG